MEDSVFTKMLKGQIPYQKVYEDELTFAFLDYMPLTKGHLLVVPKEQIDKIEDCSPELYAAIFSTVQKMSVLLKEKLKPLRIAVVVHGLEVAHAHVHVAPLYTGEEIDLAAKERETPTAEELQAVADLLKS